MQIKVVFDPSTSSAPAGFFTAVNAAVQYWEQEIANPISVTIDFGWGEAGGSPVTGDDVGESSASGLSFSYAQVRQALIGAATSPADIQAVASLPMIDPTGGAGLSVAVAEAAALGLPTGAQTAAGSVGLNASDVFTFDPNNRAVSGDYDAIGALEHEISEVLGRIAFSGQLQDGVAQYGPLDLFRYTEPGQLALAPEAASFSTDGATLLMPFNAPSMGDAGDWSPTIAGDSFGETQAGMTELVSPIDLEVMDILGYTMAKPPGTAAHFASEDFALSGITSWAYDNARGLIYLSTTTGLIEAYNPANSTTTELADVGQFVQALAVSPDSGALYVGLQGDVSNPSGGVVQTMDLVNLATGAVSAETYTGNTLEDGPASIVIASDGVGYFVPTINGSGEEQLHSFSTTGTLAPTIIDGQYFLGSGRDEGPTQDLGPRLVLSEDGRYLLAADVASSPGTLLLVDAQTGAEIAHVSVNDGTLGKADVNGAAGLIVDVDYNTITVFNLQFGLVKDLSLLQMNSHAIIGAHFSEDGSELYLWDQPEQDLLVYSTSTWSQIGAIALSTEASNVVGNGVIAGTMSLVDNGRLLLLNSGSGFEIVDLRPGEHREDFTGDGRSDFLVENGGGAVVTGEVENNQASLALVSSLGPEWSFRGTGDFLGDGRSDMLIENSAGAVAVGEITDGQAAYTPVSALGPEWSFVGTGDFLGDEKDQFLIQNTAGAVVVGEVANGQASYSLVGALGSEWKFVGAGDFLGDGKDDFLIENTAGAVVVGEVTGGQASYSLVSALGPEWKFVGSGDVLGDGKDDFLIENSAGAIVAGEVGSNGQASLTLLTALGPEWRFVGAGDYLGEGHDQFLIENTAGAVVVGDWTGGAIHLTLVGALGSEWLFH